VRRGTPASALPIMLNSLSPNTMRQYDSPLKLWWKYCGKYNLDPYEASIPFILKFLSECFETGASYGTLNSSRSALSLILGPKIGTDDRIKRLMKGIYRSKPPKPKYNSTWDPGVVLNYLVTLPMANVPLEILTRKLVTLLALTTGHRVQTLSFISLSNITFSDDRVKIFIPDIIKTSRKGSLQPLLQLPTYQSKIEICPVKTLNSYIKATESLRNDQDRLILTFKRPYLPASTQTISRWIKKTLKESGIDVNTFTAHSTRHSSTSAALRSGINIDQIQKTAGWSGSSAIFARHYNRPVGQSLNFSQAVLDVIL
jgi:site-specific recombinase XerD